VLLQLVVQREQGTLPDRIAGDLVQVVEQHRIQLFEAGKDRRAQIAATVERQVRGGPTAFTQADDCSLQQVRLAGTGCPAQPQRHLTRCPLQGAQVLYRRQVLPRAKRFKARRNLELHAEWQLAHHDAPTSRRARDTATALRM
jgi:hypothetical protein